MTFRRPIQTFAVERAFDTPGATYLTAQGPRGKPRFCASGFCAYFNLGLRPQRSEGNFTGVIGILTKENNHLHYQYETS